MSSFEPTDTPSWAGRPIAHNVDDAMPRARIVATGTIQSTQAVGGGTGAFLRCTFADGTGELGLLFGRRRVPGIEAGTRCTIEGTVGQRGGRLEIWNPWYRLEARSGPGPAPPVRPAPTPPVAAPPPAGRRRPPAPPGASGELGTPQTPKTGLQHLGATSRPEVEAAGHYRIYLGAAAGVGKTVAMLDEGQRRRRRGADVVIGLAECHGRYVTQARTAGIEVVPRKVVEYRGVQLEEMDLDAILSRRPQVALVDELAHTNVPGSGRHAKRWEDVLELLGSNIDVITTVNIQHLESIADAVERITGAPVRERVPDWVVRRANQIELVDSSPEQLRRRMIHGNIYPLERVDHALAHFFRADNLTALRELALRFLADETEEELLTHLQRHDPGAVWETAERILAGVTTAPGTDAIIRRASRMAARVKADLHVVYVRSADGRTSSAGDRLGFLRRVASDVGAEWYELEGDDPARVLIDFARRHQITQIVLGSSQRSRWQELATGGSIARRVARLAAEVGIDIHIIARREPME